MARLLKKILTTVFIVCVFLIKDNGVDRVSCEPQHGEDSLRPEAAAVSSDEEFHFHLKSLAAAIEKAKKRDRDRGLEYFKNQKIVSSANIEKLCSTLTGLLDFAGGSRSQIYRNIAVINLLAELPPCYKDLPMAKEVGVFLDYKGAFQEAVTGAVRNFFELIPDELVFEDSDTGQSDIHHNEGKLPLLADITQYRRDVGRHPMLTPVGEFKLGALGYLKNEEATGQLASSNTRLVISIAYKYKWCGLPLPDLIEAGNLGLVEAAASFEPQKGINFSTYAYDRIRYAIIGEMAENKVTISMPPYKRRLLNRYKKECAIRNIDPKDTDLDEAVAAEIAEALGVKAEKIREMPHMLFTISSLEKLRRDRDKDDRDATLWSVIKVEDREIKESECIEMLARMTIELETRLAKRWRSWQRQRNFQIYRLGILSVFTGGGVKSLRKRAAAFNVSYERVRQVERQARQELGKVLISLNIDAEYMSRVIAFARERWRPEELEQILRERIEEITDAGVGIEEPECLEIFTRIVMETEDMLNKKWPFSRTKGERMEISRILVVPLLRDEAPIIGGKAMALKEISRMHGVYDGMTSHLKTLLRSEAIPSAKRHLGVDSEHFDRIAAYSKKIWSLELLNHIIWEEVARLRKNRDIQHTAIVSQDKIQRQQGVLTAISRAV